MEGVQKEDYVGKRIKGIKWPNWGTAKQRTKGTISPCCNIFSYGEESYLYYFFGKFSNYTALLSSLTCVSIQSAVSNEVLQTWCQWFSSLTWDAHPYVPAELLAEWTEHPTSSQSHYNLSHPQEDRQWGLGRWQLSWLLRKQRGTVVVTQVWEAARAWANLI